MEDFDVFTNEINFTQPVFKNVLHKYAKDIPSTPSSANYQSAQKLLAEECFFENKEKECAFHFSEAVSASVRTLAIYREEQDLISGDKLQKLTKYIKPVKNLIDSKPLSKEEAELVSFITDFENTTKVLDDIQLHENEPFYKQYLKFGPHNNVDNMLKILSELPQEWTIVQLTAPYNPNENIKPHTEYRCDINSVYLTVYSNDYLNDGPLTVTVPANITKEGEKPLFTELFSLLDDNYKTIDNAQYLNNKRLIRNYWSRREDVDLRMKSVINVMDKDWLGGWSSLLTGKIADPKLQDKIVNMVDCAIADWGFLKLNTKQKILLYNLMDSCPSLQMQQIKSCIRKILTEYGNMDEIKSIQNSNECENCSKEFRFSNELCLKCLSKCFEEMHKFSLVDGIRAFSHVATQIKENDEWAVLRKAKRHPVILIVDEMLDTFPWESLPVLNLQPVTRMENIHFLYMLYKIHQNRIVEGYFEAKSEVGRYIINPDKDLARMELRMKSFLSYWCAGWRGRTGEPPASHELLHYLAEADVFLYCGHGDGLSRSSGGAGSGAVCVLAGCGSARLAGGAGRAPPAAAHHALHAQGCPMVVGMLWEVTDLEVDKLVTSLLALALPSDARADWRTVGKAAWNQGQLDTNVEQKTPIASERDLLRAISKSRNATNFLMISTSIVARGLPVRIS
ncbi:uncharacterized protein LOC123700208 [Colias croceus]|uniref:uncharacterized protein LOC123700208 n=1 Tax=Colias crocea TaxID=72248 RepID=UPI001E279FB7|nr:uncharacterized protein LOC123700208 [Colias croceus]